MTDTIILGDSPIEKSVKALLKIHQLIEVGYGGNVDNSEENFNPKKVCFHIGFYYGYQNKPSTFAAYGGTTTHHPIRFHTKEQAEEFISYPENVQLLKDYFML